MSGADFCTLARFQSNKTETTRTTPDHPNWRRHNSAWRNCVRWPALAAPQWAAICSWIADCYIQFSSISDPIAEPYHPMRRWTGQFRFCRLLCGERQWTAPQTGTKLSQTTAPLEPESSTWLIGIQTSGPTTSSWSHFQWHRTLKWHYMAYYMIRQTQVSIPLNTSNCTCRNIDRERS